MSQLAERLTQDRAEERRPGTVRLQVEDGGLRSRRVAVARRRAWNERALRFLNVVVAVVGLILTMPLQIVIAILVKLSSPGPVFFTQPRVGIDRRRSTPTPEELSRREKDYGGRLFQIFKFRTMVQGDARPSQVWACEDDPRITRIGAVLRKYRLDELPQLWNVLRGDMNIVGPRPEQPEIFRDLREQVAAYQRRQQVLPGITGLAQVSHHYDRSVDDVRTKVRYDLEYIHRRSLVEDLRIMARTLPVMVGKKGSL